MIPKTMSNQHPDNALMPEWRSNKNIITNEDEIEEAYIAYKKLGIQEVMWYAIESLIQNFSFSPFN